MEKFLLDILANSSVPVLSAFVLGLMTAISPCPLATNITAIGFISKDVESNTRVFISGLIYTLGRAISYTLIATIIYLGADEFKLSSYFQQYGEKILGPLLILIGIFMLDIIRFNFLGIGKLSKRFEEKKSHSYWDVLLLGMLFALAFCPYSGVMYFGMLVPMTLATPSGFYLPMVFAIATGIPVIVFAWLLAYAVSSVGKAYNALKTFERWFRLIVAFLFIFVGIYYIWLIYF